MRRLAPTSKSHNICDFGDYLLIKRVTNEIAIKRIARIVVPISKTLSKPRLV